MNEEPFKIIDHYNQVWAGIKNYYCCAWNIHKLGFFHMLLNISLGKTLAGKYKTTRRKLKKKYGKRYKITTRIKEGKTITREFHSSGILRNIDSFPEIQVKEPVDIYYNRRSKTKLGHICSVCGSNKKIVMHHLRHIRKQCIHFNLVGFDRILGYKNRKQIPVCKICHASIHKGEYDGLRLKDLANLNF